MIAMNIASRNIVLTLVAVPVALFAIYISWLIVPMIVREVVPEVVGAVLDMFK